jgi:hypothetical protein
MRRVIIPSLATTAVMSGIIITGVGVAAADQEKPTGGDQIGSVAPACGAGELDFERGCFLSWGPFFK